MMKRLIILLNLLWGAPLLNAQSFAIVVDADSYTHCGPQIEAYAASVRADGLEAFVAAGPWETPDDPQGTASDLGLQNGRAERPDAGFLRPVGPLL